jgi:hypothetical protein
MSTRFASIRQSWRHYGLLVAVLSLFGLLLVGWSGAVEGLIAWTSQEAKWDSLRRTPLTPLAPLDDQAWVTLRRTTCFGECPDYSLKLFASGRVEFEGRYFVCAQGRRVAHVDGRAASRLIQDLEAADFFNLAWAPGNLWTDAPSASMTLHLRGREKCIHHYHGDEGAPRLAFKMEDEIDAIANSAQWLPGRSDSRTQCLLPDGSRRPAFGFESPP